MSESVTDVLEGIRRELIVSNYTAGITLAFEHITDQDDADQIEAAIKGIRETGEPPYNEEEGKS